MGNVFVKVSSIICTLSILAPQVAWSAASGGGACAAVGLPPTMDAASKQTACTKIIQNYDACTAAYQTAISSAQSSKAGGMSSQAGVAGTIGATNANVANGAAQTGTGTLAGGTPLVAASDGQAQGCIGSATTAKGHAATMTTLSGQYKSVGCGGDAPAAPTAHEGLIAECNKMVADNKGIMSGLSKAALPLAALAAGAIGGYMLGKSSGDDAEESDDGDGEETAAAAGAEPAAAAEDSCGENAEKNAAGLCVVKSEDDTCYAADGKTEDKSKVRDSKGVCVSTSSLCQTGYDYDTVNQVCKKSTCQTGFSENESGECVSNGTGGNTIAVGTPDPIIGEDPAATEEDKETLAEKLAKNKAATPGSTSSGGGSSARNAASAPAAAGKGSGGFGASGGSSGAGGSGGGFGAGSFAANSAGGEQDAGKDSEVQYQAVKWANPKKGRPLRDVLRK